MTILDKFNRIRHRHSEIKDFCINTVRFKKLLENATALLDLFEDGNEKLKGEYILDGHYVTSLIDDIIDNLGLVVYDACTLAPEKGQALFARFDKHKAHVRDRILKNNGQTEPDDHGKSTEDPEYRLLSNVLTWFNGNATEMSVMELMRESMIAGICGIHDMDGIKREQTHAIIDFPGSENTLYVIDLWKDPIDPLKQQRSLKNTDSIPLKLLFAKALSTNTQPGQVTGMVTPEWVAVASEDEISLNTLKPGVNFRLDAAMSGHEKSNYIFIYADSSLDSDLLLPEGFDTRKTASGILAWKRNTSAAVIEDNLVAIGENLFGNWNRPD